MAPKPQNREYSAVELAMLDDIGAGRVDELPLEDRGTVPRGGAAQASIESGRTGTRNTWNDAIASGIFEDEDAAVVAGQRALANGQLARMRRAADLSFMAVNRKFEYNDRRLRKDHNGQVAPRAQFSRGRRAHAQAGMAHTGDGPVELRTATRSCHHPLPHTPVATFTAQRRIDPKWNAKVLLKTSSPSSPAAQNLNGAAPTAQPAGVPVQSGGPQSVTFSLQLPEGYSVLFQATVIFASPTFINRAGEYPGTIYLVTGPSPVDDDHIILHIDEDRVTDVKRRTKEYVDYLSDADRLILQFKDDSSHMTWFVVIFRQRDVMVSFVDALRGIVDRLKKPSPSLASTQVCPGTVNTPAVPSERPHNTSAPTVESHLQHDTMEIVSVAILEDIVSWAVHIVAFIRDAGPAELANADALPGIIRGASAAVLMEKHVGFSDLESKQRVAFVDEVCVPKVYERFQRRLMEEESKKRPAKSVSKTIQQTSSTEQKTEPRRRSTYAIDKLIQLESGAIHPPDWLTELKYLPEMGPENRVRVRDTIQRAYEIHSSPAPTQTAQVPKAEHGLDGNVSPGCARGVRSTRSDAVVARTAPSITVTAPPGMSNPEEPLVSIHGEMNGLNSSRHNMSGGDILGHSSGHFTGTLSQGKSHLEDLMLLDRVEDFEMIRAQDPEVAEIADRFAQIHFDEEGPN